MQTRLLFLTRLKGTGLKCMGYYHRVLHKDNHSLVVHNIKLSDVSFPFFQLVIPCWTLGNICSLECESRVEHHVYVTCIPVESPFAATNKLPKKKKKGKLNSKLCSALGGDSIFAFLCFLRFIADVPHCWMDLFFNKLLCVFVQFHHQIFHVC